MKRLGLTLEEGETPDGLKFHRIRDAADGHVALLHIGPGQAGRESWYVSSLCVRICHDALNLSLGKPILVFLYSLATGMPDKWRQEAEGCKGAELVRDIKFCEVSADIERWVESAGAISSVHGWARDLRRFRVPLSAGAPDKPTRLQLADDRFDAAPSPRSLALASSRLEPQWIVPKRTVFISYAHVEQVYFDKLRVALWTLGRELPGAIWSDKDIPPGEDFLNEIRASLESSQVIIALVSQQYLASDFIYHEELREALRATRAGQKKLLWILLGDCQYESEGLARLMAVNDLKRPLKEMSDVEQEKTLNQVAHRLRDILERLYPTNGRSGY